MNTMKFIQTLTAAAIFLAITPALTMGQDTGYPWYGDIQDKDHPPVSRSGKVVETPVLPSEVDTGKPWFADIKDDNKSTMKRVTIFKTPSGPVGQDSGYPWYADTQWDDPGHLMPQTKVQ